QHGCVISDPTGPGDDCDFKTQRARMSSKFENLVLEQQWFTSRETDFADQWRGCRHVAFGIQELHFSCRDRRGFRNAVAAAQRTSPRVDEADNMMAEHRRLRILASNGARYCDIGASGVVALGDFRDASELRQFWRFVRLSLRTIIPSRLDSGAVSLGFGHDCSPADDIEATFALQPRRC